MLHRSLTSSEKFLFYRGLGHFDIPLKTTADKDSVFLDNTGKEDIPFALAWRTARFAGWALSSPAKMHASLMMLL